MLQEIYKKITKSYNAIALLLAVLTCVVIFTYIEITNNELLDIKNPKKIIVLLIIDLILFLFISTIVARKIFKLWHKEKHQSGRLQNRIILMFCLIASIPTIIVTVFSMIFFNFGIHSWFDQRVSTAINESVVVAESYFRVQWKLIESDANIMAQDLNYLAPELSYGPERLSNYLSKQADDKSLVEAVIFQLSPNKIIAQSRYNLNIPFATLSKEAIDQAATGNIVVMQEDNDNKVRSLIKLNFLPNCYLLVSRNIDTKVLDHVINARGAASEYARLQGQVSNLQIQFLVIFVVVAMVILFAAIWLALILSAALVKPLNTLVSATESIKEGNFDIEINVKNSTGEIAVLANAFIKMAQELSNQRNKLIEANLEIQEKHNFNEAVLSSVSTGIVAIDSNHHISTINPSALNILSINKDQNILNTDFNLICPEISSVLGHTQSFIGHELKKEIIINRNNKKSILALSIIPENFSNKIGGYIVTFDDITTLVLAQRSAAWSDVARKIAHEIKNPLTPIHLAAERLKRKYSHEVSDIKNFEKYTEIIVKHVKDIGTMVEEFVQFARMPTPNFEHVDLNQIVRDSIFSRKCLEKNIQYVPELPERATIINCDIRQISQVLLNLLKNAEESIEHSSNSSNGEIIIRLIKNNMMAELYVIDNGEGFSADLFDRLTEPYTTNKSTGTGLGLAIVKKILDDHKAEISFANNTNNHGAVIKLIFNIVE